MLTQLPRLYAITDARLMPGATLFSKVEAALKGGCGWVQYRDKTNDSRRRLQDANKLRELCEHYQAKLIVNDDPQLALASRAHGVHLGQGDTPLAEARRLLGTSAIIGSTCHASVDLAIAGHAQGADYLAFGRFFASTTKPGASPASLTLISQIKHQLAVPVVVIGGITLQNAPQLLQAGADCLAVCEGLFSAENVESQATAFRQLFLD